MDSVRCRTGWLGTLQPVKGTHIRRKWPRPKIRPHCSLTGIMARREYQKRFGGVGSGSLQPETTTTTTISKPTYFVLVKLRRLKIISMGSSTIHKITQRNLSNFQKTPVFFFFNYEYFSIWIDSEKIQ